jgi:two-component system phosphate regulon sensor histidine kinase PhoR
MYHAQRVAGADSQDAFVRLAVHMRALDEHLGAFYTGIALAAGLAVLGTALLSYLFARRHTAPLVELTQMADALRQGQLNRRVLPENVGEMGTLATALNAMAQSLSSQMAQTAQGRTQLMAVLSSMSEGVIATDTHQNVLLSNAAAARLLGFPAGDMTGRFLWELVRHEPILQAVNDVLARRIPTHGQVGPIEGRHLDVTCCTFPADQPPQGLVIVAHDATQSVRYQELRKEFVANVSHELRTPLTAIKGFAETLRDSALDDPARARQYLSTIEKHANQLTNLVNDLLELSRLENYPGVPQCMPLDVGALIRRAVEMLRPAATRKQQTLHVDLQPGLPSMTANPDYLERAVANLLDNAVKYTPEDGTITVSARTCQRPEAKGVEQVVISVADTGIGIPAADLPRIFERFYRVDRSRSRDMGGTGLGLSIVKHIAQSHGGRIEVSSTPGKGSTFRMILPAHPPED